MGKIINTGRNLPPPTLSDQLELWEHRHRLVEKPILNQSKRDGSVLYGAYAVNKILGKGFGRPTYDFDVKSPMPLKHAIEIEKSIDRGTNSDLAFVKQTSFDHKGKKQILFRVVTKISERIEADFSFKPKKMKTVKIGGVNYEVLSEAQKKNLRMIKNPQFGRGYQAHVDMYRINLYNFIKKHKGRI